jgi:putative membrane protein
MLTTATGGIAPDFRKNRLLQGLLAGYLLFWTAMAVDPYNRSDWLLENLLVFVAVPALLITYRRFPLSDTSYLLITIFMTLHAVGAHYTYEKVPMGYWVQEILGLGRNHFDRLVHFAFGLLIAYPMREGLIRLAGVRSGWAYYLPASGVLSWSGLYEIVEFGTAVIVSPELGTAYLGTQGDVWDAQKDMAAALGGAALCMAATAALHRIFSRPSGSPGKRRPPPSARA